MFEQSFPLSSHKYFRLSLMFEFLFIFVQLIIYVGLYIVRYDTLLAAATKLAYVQWNGI